MSKKNNPKNTRIGLTKNWNYSIQNYGNNLKTYFLLNQILYFTKTFIFKFFTKKNITLIYKEIWYNKNYVFIYFYLLNSNFNYLNLLKNMFYVLKIFSFKKIFFKIFMKKSWIFSPVLINFYVKNIFFKHKFNPKKIIGLITILLSNLLNSNQIFFLKNGPQKVILKGFKIQLKGRFENTKNKMAKIMVIQNGNMSLVNLNTEINYLNSYFSTKLGSCSLKIWLFYKLKNE